MSQPKEKIGPTRELGGALSPCDWHEPYELRGSRTDLWETGGEIPPVYLAHALGGSTRLYPEFRYVPLRIQSLPVGEMASERFG